MIRKNLRDGGTAAIEAWHDGIAEKTLYRVNVQSRGKNASIALPLTVRDGTWERVVAIFNSIDERDTFNDVMYRELLC